MLILNKMDEVIKNCKWLVTGSSHINRLIWIFKLIRRLNYGETFLTVARVNPSNRFDGRLPDGVSANKRSNIFEQLRSDLSTWTSFVPKCKIRNNFQ